MVKLVQQNVRSLNDLLRVARASAPWFESTSSSFAKKTGGDFLGINFKADKDNNSVPSARAHEKAAEKGNNKDGIAGHLLIKDMIRTSISYATCLEIAEAINAMPKYFEVVEAKDHVTQPKPGGYIDLNFIVVCPDTRHLCELQIHFKSLLDAKKHGGHAAYKNERAATGGKNVRHVDDSVARGRATRAIHAGQDAYRDARILIANDPGFTKMMAQFQSLDAVANANAHAFMAANNNTGPPGLQRNVGYRNLPKGGR